MMSIPARTTPSQESELQKLKKKYANTLPENHEWDVIYRKHKELEDYETAKATVRFPLTEKLPMPLIRKLLKARKELNEAKKKK